MAFPLINPIYQFFDNAGEPLAGGLLQVYAPGGVTPKNTWKDENLSTLNDNPIVLDSGGRCVIFLADGEEYKFVLMTAASVVLKTVDEVKSPSGITQANIGTALYPISSYETAAGMTTADLTDSWKYYGDIERYGADPSGASNSSPALQKAWNQQKFGGHPMYAGPGVFRLNDSLTFSTQGGDTFTQGPILRGAGMYNTVFDCRKASGTLFNLSSGGTVGTEFALQAIFSDFTINNLGSVAAASYFDFSTFYNTVIERVWIRNATADGLKLPVHLGDTDANTWFVMRNCWIHGCRGWGVNGIPDSTFNQTSFLRFEMCWWQDNGTAMATTAITGVTLANPAVITAASHGKTNGQRVLITQNPFTVGAGPAVAYAGGMTELSGFYRVQNATTNTFELTFEGAAVNSTGYTAYTGSGLLVENGVPTSGALACKFQIMVLETCAFTINANRALYVPGTNGLSVNLGVLNTTFENNRKVHIDLGGVDVGRFSNFQIYNNTLNYATRGLVLDGTDNLVRNIIIENPYLRAETSSCPYVAFERFGANCPKDLCSIRFVGWSNFDSTGHQRIKGFQFPNVAMTCDLVVDGATSVLLRPSTQQYLARGNVMPLRLAGPANGLVRSTTGEWTEARMPDNGVVLSNSGLANTTVYSVYLYDNAGTPALEAVTTAWVRDAETGYPVKTGDATRLFVGRVITDGSAQFVTAGVGYLNPTAISGSQTGVPAYIWQDSTGDLRVDTALPTGDTTDGVIVGTQV